MTAVRLRSFECSASIPDDLANQFESLADQLVGITDVLLRDQDTDIPSVRIVIADNVWDTAVVEAHTLGCSDTESRDGPERLAGIVAGKTLRSPDDELATLVLSSSVFDSDAPIWRATAVAAHEFGHVIYGAARARHIAPRENAWLPWDVAEVTHLVTAEEFRVECFAHIATDLLITVTSADGETIPYRSAVHPSMAAMATNAVEMFHSEALDVIDRYRRRLLPGDDGERLGLMWNTIARMSGDLAKALVLEHAARTAGGTMLDYPDTEASATAALACRSLLEYLDDHFRIPDADDWPADREVLSALGHEAWLATWQRLGLTPTPLADTFHLAVSDPQF